MPKGCIVPPQRAAITITGSCFGERTIGTHQLRFFEKLKIKNIFELRELARIYQVDLSQAALLRLTCDRGRSPDGNWPVTVVRCNLDPGPVVKGR